MQDGHVMFSEDEVLLGHPRLGPVGYIGDRLKSEQQHSLAFHKFFSQHQQVAYTCLSQRHGDHVWKRITIRGDFLIVFVLAAINGSAKAGSAGEMYFYAAKHGKAQNYQQGCFHDFGHGIETDMIRRHDSNVS